MDNNNGYFFLSVLANLCQLYDLTLNLNETSNDEIMKVLERQDKALDEQTDVYLKKIVKQNEIIIKQNEEILEKLEEIIK